MMIQIRPETWEHCTFEQLNKEDDMVTFSRDGHMLTWHVDDIIGAGHDIEL